MVVCDVCKMVMFGIGQFQIGDDAGFVELGVVESNSLGVSAFPWVAHSGLGLAELGFLRRRENRRVSWDGDWWRRGGRQGGRIHLASPAEVKKRIKGKKVKIILQIKV